MKDIPNLTARLHELVADIASLHSQLILLVAPPGGGKTALLRAYAARYGVPVLSVGATLAALPRQERPLQAGTRLRELMPPPAPAGGARPCH